MKLTQVFCQVPSKQTNNTRQIRNKLHQNVFGSRALARHDGGAYSTPPDSLDRFGDGARGR